MRRLILALMIVLLPVRGWMVNAMAVEPVAGTAIAVASLARGGHADCAGHALADALVSNAMPGDPAGTGAFTDNDPAAHGGACTVCQVCHTVAMGVDAPLLAAMPLPALAPASSLPRFTSAVPSPGLKPPIS